MLCDPCADRLHRTGNMSGHLRVPIDKCEECSFQVGPTETKTSAFPADRRDGAIGFTAS